MRDGLGMRVMSYGKPKRHLRLRPQQLRYARKLRNIWRDGIMGEVRPFAAILIFTRSAAIDFDFDDDLVLSDALIVKSIVMIPVAVVAKVVVDIPKRKMPSLGIANAVPTQCLIDCGLLLPVIPTI